MLDINTAMFMIAFVPYNRTIKGTKKVIHPAWPRYCVDYFPKYFCQSLILRLVVAEPSMLVALAAFFSFFTLYIHIILNFQ